PAPEGLRAAHAVLGRSARLPDLGRVRRLGRLRLRPDGRQPAADGLVRRPVDRGRRARPQPPQHHRLVPAERDPPGAPRPPHPAGRRHPGDVRRDQARRPQPPRARCLRLLPPRARRGRVRLPLLRAGRGTVPCPAGPAGRGQALGQRSRARTRRDALRRRLVLPALRGPALLRLRVRRDLVERAGGPRGRRGGARREQRRRLLGLRRTGAQRGGALRALRGPHPGAARGPADVRLLLHAADRRLPGEERRGRLRTRTQARSRPSARGPAAGGRVRAGVTRTGPAPLPETRTVTSTDTAPTDLPTTRSPLTLDDVPALTALLNRIDAADGTGEPAEEPSIREWLTLPGLDLERDTLAARDEDALIGFVAVDVHSSLDRDGRVRCQLMGG